jgi:quinol-cytochrome oxidoreductase complex cytochrome b subunit
MYVLRAHVPLAPSLQIRIFASSLLLNPVCIVIVIVIVIGGLKSDGLTTPYVGTEKKIYPA